jgi:hypothetical protein
LVEISLKNRLGIGKEFEMSEEPKMPPEEMPSEGKSSTSETGWQEVGRQFQALGESLAQAMRTAWENAETQRRVAEMRTGLEAMARDVSKAVEDTANTPQGQKVRQEAEHTAATLRNATEQTVQEVRPQLINALQQVNSELQKLIDRMEPKDTPPGGPDSPE